MKSDLAEAELDGLRQVLQPYKEARQRLAKVLGRVQSSGDEGDQSDDLRVTLRSPIAGTLVEVSVTSGELVNSKPSTLPRRQSRYAVDRGQCLGIRFGPSAKGSGGKLSAGCLPRPHCANSWMAAGG